MNVISLSGQEAASATDLLNSGRLQAMPGNGILMFEFQASVATPTNKHEITISLPGGDVPVSLDLVPAGTVATVGILDDRTSRKYRFYVRLGGHCVVATLLTGASTLTWKITYKGT